jgi:hypothetical protein
MYGFLLFNSPPLPKRQDSVTNKKSKAVYEAASTWDSGNLTLCNAYLCPPEEKNR